MLKPKKKIVFLTGTRADFGKLKSLITVLEQHSDFQPHVFVTGMHLMKEYGYTLIDVERAGFSQIHTFSNHTSETTMDLTLAKTMQGFSSFVKEVAPDLIVVHGDRVEALAGALVGSLNNILVAHIEGGELSGTIDELIRHSTSKMSHIHFVSNQKAAGRLLQMGELPESIQIIGSPDIDIMFSNTLPELDHAKRHYDIDFDEYRIAMFHPVTTEYEHMEEYSENYVEALAASDQNFIVVYPNNDLGSAKIIKALERLKDNPRFRIFPSIRFEYFLVLLKNSAGIVGNSSAGIREAPYYGIPTINIGSRQENRSNNKNIANTSYASGEILAALKQTQGQFKTELSDFGDGNSSELFLKCLQEETIWKLPHQKTFVDIE